MAVQYHWWYFWSRDTDVFIKLSIISFKNENSIDLIKLQSNSIARNSMQFREYLIASLFAIPPNEMGQAEAIIARDSAQLNSDLNP